MPRALLVDDEPAIRRALRRILAGIGWEIVEASDGADGIERVREDRFDLIITDLRMPNADGHQVIREVQTHRPETPIVVLTGHGAVTDCVRAMRAGAHDFLSKPFQITDIERVAGEALATRRPVAESVRGTGTRPQGVVLGDSPRLRAVLDVVARVAETDATVLVTGETGTGKEVVARLLHATSGRAGGPFVAVNCGAIPENLVESELFGHARGAFTGAVKDRAGRFVQADGGTLFLDEIGDLPLPVQVKLLRATQEREVVPVGEDRPVRFDARLIAATHRDLHAMADAGTFRSDLLYRLNVVTIEMPALRERAEDIPGLARHFVEMAGRRHGRRVELRPAALEAMVGYSWPGNVRELENLMERLVVLAREAIDLSDLPPKVRGEASARPSREMAAVEPPGDGTLNLEDNEWRLIDEALKRTGGNKNKAAALLGIKRTTLVERLKRRPID